MTSAHNDHGLHGEYVGLGPLDEFPIHQLPRPVAWAGSSDRNFYDRCYLNCHDRTGDLFLITGLGFYPNLGTKDAFVLLRRELDGRSEQTAVHLSDAADPRGGDRMAQQVGAYRIEVLEPLRRLRLVMEETEGIGLDLTWEGSFDVVQELPHVMRQGSGTTLDAQRFAQVGTWEGVISVDGSDIAVTPDVWLGTRDRSWGSARSARPRPPASPRTRRSRDVVALRADAVRGVLRGADHPGDPRRLPHPQRLHPHLGRRPGRAARLAAGGDPLRLGDPGADRRHHRVHHPVRRGAGPRGDLQARRTDPRRRRLRR
ncbi:hypothetical protein [Nocardioides sambongensis]|uniref:hypothetical protein n=1 Tax=Nocardioides sambongensis TaxID=2589074 RepID=UPI001E3845F1|nr:hypothetical protein [Nocardioides sambongensis]